MTSSKSYPTYSLEFVCALELCHTTKLCFGIDIPHQIWVGNILVF